MRDRTNLPPAVLARLDESRRSLEELGVATPVWRNSAPLLLEARRTGTIEKRAGEDDTFGVRGYAAIVEQPYPVAGGKASGWGWDETLDAHAFDRALTEDDVRFLLNHEGVPMARSRAGQGTLDLWVDNVGLGMEAKSLDVENPDVVRLRSAIRREDMDQMSYAFRATRQEWNEDYTERRILEVRLYDVAAVTYPANEATIIGERQAKPEPPATRGMSLDLARAITDGVRANRIPA